jgi:hypothetical protein
VYVAFIHGPGAAGKHTVASRLAEITGLPLFHNHLAVDAAKSLFAFGTPAFNRMRAQIWRTAFAEAADASQSFIFTFHPEASVDPALIDEMCESVRRRKGRVHFIELRCARETILRRVGEASRTKFGKLTDPVLYQELEAAGAFEFPPLPDPLLVVDTDKVTPIDAAAQIARAIAERTPVG